MLSKMESAVDRRVTYDPERGSEVYYFESLVKNSDGCELKISRASALISP